MSTEDRVLRKDLLSKVMTAREAARLIRDGITLACSGFTSCGYPKVVPLALAERVRKGDPVRINLITGASVGEELDEELASVGAIARRYPYQTGDMIGRAINDGAVMYHDIHLSRVAEQARCGFLGHLDIAVIEATAIMEDGSIIPTTSVGASPTFIHKADGVIIEVNTAQPMELAGMHDIYTPENPPRRQPIPITDPSQRIGRTSIPCDPGKIIAICRSDMLDKTRPLAAISETSQGIARHLVGFFNRCVRGKLYDDLPPLQSGVGGIANAVMGGILASDWTGISLWAEVIQDAIFDLIDAGKLACASATSLTPSPEGLTRFYRNIETYREKIILRPQEISNSAEVINRLGVVAMNTALEVDIYGNVNSTHTLGNCVINGIGGSGDFSRNAFLSIFMTPSTARGGTISRIVPCVTHVDHTEHEVHVVVTEQGVADLRGLDPRERAEVIIENCAHPDYRDALRDYYRRAVKNVGGHIPFLLDEAFSWHARYRERGTMLP
ncbi:MAG: succinate CoA transferase [Deltaproteobacteria bacterium]|nr:succinate CoA transferase [Deltaproteobacteria bacterium]